MWRRGVSVQGFLGAAGLAGVLVSLGAGVLGCGSSSAGGASSGPDGGPTEPLVDAGADAGVVRAVVVDSFLVDGVVPPPNPVSNTSTPAEYNRFRVVRWRLGPSGAPARALFVFEPGTFGGALSFDGVARGLVARSRPGEAIEVWAVDRRTNLLEDLTGLDAAERAKDAEIARRYYFASEAIGGKSFAGFVEGANARYASEWGLATHLGDLRKLLETIPAAERPRRVFLGGHSLGASAVEAYAAWDFEGIAGYTDLAGLVLVDGVARREGDAAATVDRSAYESGGSGGPFGGAVNVSTIRGGEVFGSLPLLGARAFVVAEYLGIAAAADPTGVRADPERDQLLGLLLGLNAGVPKMTNRAALGFGFDSESNFLGFTTVSCGRGTGGAIEPYTSLTGARLTHPTDLAATYDWQDFDAVTPKDATSIADLARSWYLGEGTNFAEWYFPNRLPLDANVAATLNVEESDWRFSAYGIRAKHGRAIDVPIFGGAFGLVRQASAFDKLKALVAPIGAGRPNAGLPRTDPRAFVARAWPDLTHVDAILATDAPGSLAAEWYDALAAFAYANTPSGTFVPRP
jgi:hypothetical protein